MPKYTGLQVRVIGHRRSVSFATDTFYLCRVVETGKNIDKAADLIRDGRLVAVPTETVYGLAANALDEKAVLSIFEAKRRPFFDPLIVHIPSISEAAKYAQIEDFRLVKLAKVFWPGPLTILAQRKDIIPDIVTSGLPRVAIRVPNHNTTLELLRKLNLPVAAPSANPFGYISPTEPAHVEKQLGDKVSYILDGGKCEVGIESTIAGIEGNDLVIYRLGGLPVEEIERVAGKTVLKLNLSGDPDSPGQLKSHYAPRKPLLFGERETLLKMHPGKKRAVIAFGSGKQAGSGDKFYNLSEKGDLAEAALNLFRYMRMADESDAEIILAEKLPETGLGRAINDRLRRAAFR